MLNEEGESFSPNLSRDVSFSSSSRFLLNAASSAKCTTTPQHSTYYILQILGELQMKAKTRAVTRNGVPLKLKKNTRYVFFFFLLISRRYIFPPTLFISSFPSLFSAISHTARKKAIIFSGGLSG